MENDRKDPLTRVGVVNLNDLREIVAGLRAGIDSFSPPVSAAIIDAVEALEEQVARSLLTDREQTVLDMLVAAWEGFVALPELHERDRTEFMTAVHAAQRIVISRVWRRRPPA